MAEACNVIEFEDIRDWKRALPRVRRAIGILEADPVAYIKPESLYLRDVAYAAEQWAWDDQQPSIIGIDSEDSDHLIDHWSVEMRAVQILRLCDLLQMLEQGPPQWAAE